MTAASPNHRPTTRLWIPFRVNAPHLPAVRSPTTPRCPRLTDLLSSPGLTARVSSHPVPGLLASWASPFSSRLATATGRIEFVNLPTSSSPPVAPHAASRRRSYLRLSRPGLAPSEDFHLTDSVRSQAHWRAASLPPGKKHELFRASRVFQSASIRVRFSPPGWEARLFVRQGCLTLRNATQLPSGSGFPASAVDRPPPRSCTCRNK